MNRIKHFADCFFLPVWLSVSAWFIFTTYETLNSNSSDYVKLVQTIITIVMMSFWIFVLVKYRKNNESKKAQQSIDNVDT